MPASELKRRLTAFVGALAVLTATPLAVVASDAFSDVPDSNVHHDDITWLADNGITAGCNPPANDEYCPDEPVLRQQMASFMRRLAEKEVVNADTANRADHATTADSATTAADADTADGLDPEIMTPRATFNASENLPDETTSLEATITAPAPGILVMSAAIDTHATPGSSALPDCRVTINQKEVPGTRMISEIGSDNLEEDCTTSGAAAVPAGTYEVAVMVFPDGAYLDNGSITVMWVPLDGTGSTPTTFTQLDVVSEQPDGAER